MKIETISHIVIAVLFALAGHGFSRAASQLDRLSEKVAQHDVDLATIRAEFRARYPQP